MSRGQKRRVIHAAIRLIYERIRNKEISSSMADLIRLLELDSDMAPQQPQEVQASWAEASERTPKNTAPQPS
jgi:hypothetical protein